MEQKRAVFPGKCFKSSSRILSVFILCLAVLPRVYFYFIESTKLDGVLNYKLSIFANLCRSAGFCCRILCTFFCSNLYRPVEICRSLQSQTMTNILLKRIPSYQQLLNLLQRTLFPKYYNNNTFSTKRLPHVKFYSSKRSQYGKRASQSSTTISSSEITTYRQYRTFSSHHNYRDGNKFSFARILSDGDFQLTAPSVS